MDYEIRPTRARRQKRARVPSQARTKHNRHQRQRKRRDEDEETQTQEKTSVGTGNPHISARRMGNKIRPKGPAIAPKDFWVVRALRAMRKSG